MIPFGAPRSLDRGQESPERSAPGDFFYRAPKWLPGGHAQTIWAALAARRVVGDPPRLRRERWDTPDGDFIDVDHLDGPPEAPLLVLFHGLEGSSSSQYAQAFAGLAQARGWRMALPHFRGCSGELNRAPRAYHSGDYEEIGWILQRLRHGQRRGMYAVGVSLGGNALLRWAEEMEAAATGVLSAAAAVCAPLDLTVCGQALGQGFNRQVYTRMFLRSMKPRALAKLVQFPGLFSRERMLAARTLFDFDDVFTAPLHGFANAPDYYRRASAKPQLRRVRLPTLVLNARNDPFVPQHCLPAASEVGANITLAQPDQGGHVGFPGGDFPGHVLTMPEQVLNWLHAHG